MNDTIDIIGKLVTVYLVTGELIEVTGDWIQIISQESSNLPMLKVFKDNECLHYFCRFEAYSIEPSLDSP